MPRSFVGVCVDKASSRLSGPQRQDSNGSVDCLSAISSRLTPGSQKKATESIRASVVVSEDGLGQGPAVVLPILILASLKFQFALRRPNDLCSSIQCSLV